MEEVTNKNETDRLTRLVVLIQSSYKTLFRLPQKPFRTLTAIMAHCNECHQVEFGMNSIILFSNDLSHIQYCTSEHSKSGLSITERVLYVLFWITMYQEES